MITKLFILMLTDQGEYYKVEIHVSPSQESLETGSRVTLNCTVTPSSQTQDNFIFPVTYQWYSTDRGYISWNSIVTTTIVPYERDLTDYYCLVYRDSRLLGRRRTTLKIKGDGFYRLYNVMYSSTVLYVIMLYHNQVSLHQA